MPVEPLPVPPTRLVAWLDGQGGVACRMQRSPVSGVPRLPGVGLLLLLPLLLVLAV